jgi:Tfp pilus assembly protein PilX
MSTNLHTLSQPFVAGARRKGQRGVTLIVGLIMMVLITLVVINAFNLSSSNLKSVGNMQVREEAVAAANQAVEQMITNNFTNSLGTQTFAVDINKDGTADYNVAIALPVCTRSVLVSTCAGSGFESGLATGSGTCGSYLTDWDVQATVSDATSGASIVVREGIRVPMDETTASSRCP